MSRSLARQSLFSIAVAVQTNLRSLYPASPDSVLFSAYLLASTISQLFALHEASRLRAARLAAASGGPPGLCCKDGGVAEKGAAGLGPAPTNAYLVEAAYVLVGVGCLCLTLADLWILYTHVTATPDCYVIDHGVRTNETCEALYARVGRDKFTFVNN